MLNSGTVGFIINLLEANYKLANITTDNDLNE